MSRLFQDEEVDQASTLREMVSLASPQEERKIRESGMSQTKIIAITSGKGGVGKTACAVNLGLAMVQSGKKVLLFDADLGVSNVNVLMGIIPKYSLYDVINHAKKLSDIIIHTPDGLDIIPGASGHMQMANLTRSERQTMVEQMKIVQDYDIFLIDTGAGISFNVTDFVSLADDVLIICSPEPTSITDAYAIIKSVILSSMKKQNLQIIINRVQSSMEGRKVAERLTSICHKFLNYNLESLGFIYEDDHVGKAVRKQKPFYTLYPNSKASACLNFLVSKLLSQKLPDYGTRNLHTFLKTIFRLS